MTNILSPKILWPLTHLINRNSGKERSILYLSLLFFRRWWFARTVGLTVGLCFRRLFFSSHRWSFLYCLYSDIFYYPFTTFQRRFGKRTKAALSCRDLSMWLKSLGTWDCRFFICELSLWSYPRPPHFKLVTSLWPSAQLFLYLLQRFPAGLGAFIVNLKISEMLEPGLQPVCLLYL